MLDKQTLDKQMKPTSWRSGPLARWRAVLTTATVLTAAGLVLAGGTWLGPHSDSAMAREFKDQPGRTQSGARVDFSSLKDWNLKAENMVPSGGNNPLYFPLKPGFRYIMEHPNHPHGLLRIEVQVLDKTEPFDVPGIGKFECGVVQEEEFYDGVLDQRAENWFCMDKATNALYTFGEVSWEIDQVGRKVFAGTWRVGDPDGNGIAEPGLLMPGTFTVGDKYIFDGHEAEAYGYTENMESGITMTVPAGTFKDCVRTREYSLTNPSDITDKWWCPGVGLVKDTSDGELVASDALPGTDIASFGKHHREPRKQTVPPVAKVSSLAAKETALKEVPGKVTSMKIERYGKHNVYAVEIIATKDGVETDVFVDIESGKVVGTDK
ncbi:PepSY domain-containing protein [Bradyrhizobium sp. 200]|uniref:PepSY domain-containing protein n=1 Tax=Bradyrhizobium sp. 200 TaxID=2782665 RepID=UPI001FFEA537|nr:PepSY domain-containing protein [Bradyrhizobium sp. 200]UPJ52749.1 PepSY domain-containing protein [Bradyrhizobium sp. 200]